MMVEMGGTVFYESDLADVVEALMIAVTNARLNEGAHIATHFDHDEAVKATKEAVLKLLELSRVAV